MSYSSVSNFPIVERLIESGCVLKHIFHILHVGHVPFIERLVKGGCVRKSAEPPRLEHLQDAERRVGVLGRGRRRRRSLRPGSVNDAVRRAGRGIQTGAAGGGGRIGARTGGGGGGAKALRRASAPPSRSASDAPAAGGGGGGGATGGATGGAGT